MYTVKRLEPTDIIFNAEVNGKAFYYTAGFHCYAVMAPDGKVVNSRNQVTGKLMFETYKLKSTAVQSAEWHNRKSA